MVKAHDRWDLVSAADHPDRYLRTMLTCASIPHRRRWSVRHVLLSLTGEVEAGQVADPARAIVEREETWQLLAGLPARQRAVSVLRYYQGLSDAESAAVLGCLPGTVRGYGSRALAALRLELTSAESLIAEEAP